MSCPTCDHTMQGVGGGIFWCPRCGTLKSENTGLGAAEAPMLVERCRKFEGRFIPGSHLMRGSRFSSGEIAGVWRRLGIAESIARPPERSPA